MQKSELHKLKILDMTTDEKELFKDLFTKFKGLYYKQKVNADLIEKILKKLPDDTISEEEYARIERVDGNITEAELKELEEKINNL